MPSQMFRLDDGSVWAVYRWKEGGWRQLEVSVGDTVVVETSSTPRWRDPDAEYYVEGYDYVVTNLTTKESADRGKPHWTKGPYALEIASIEFHQVVLSDDSVWEVSGDWKIVNGWSKGDAIVLAFNNGKNQEESPYILINMQSPVIVHAAAALSQ